MNDSNTELSSYLFIPNESNIDKSSSPTNNTNWIREEELLLNLIQDSSSFQLTALQKIAISFLYINTNQEMVGLIEGSFALQSGEEHKSLLKWTPFKQLIDQKSKWNNVRYLFEEAAFYHIDVDYDSIHSLSQQIQYFQLTKLEKYKDFKIPLTLPVFHDLSQLFVIYREAAPYTGARLKSILKNGTKIEKTKRVRISDMNPEIIVNNAHSSSRKTRKTALSSIV